MLGVNSPPAAARAMAKAGYVFLFPLVANYQRMYTEAIDPSSPTFIGGFGRWVHERHAMSHQTELATVHLSTLVSSAWLDLRSEPWVLWIPPHVGERVTVCTDLWGFVVAEADDVASEEVEPAVIASEGWVGTVPPEVTHLVRAESPFVRCVTSIRVPEAGDLAQVQAIQRNYRLEPLSTWRNSPSAPPAPDIIWWPVETDTLVTVEFWPTATFALTLTAPHENDRGILDGLAEIGVIPGNRWDVDALDPLVIEAIGEGMDEAITELMRAAAHPDDATTMQQSRPATDGDYFARALFAIRMIGQSGRS